MAFSDPIRRVPRAFDPDRAADLPPAFADLGAEMQALLAGTAGSSPYLAGLMAREADWVLSGAEDTAAERLSQLNAATAQLSEDPGPVLRALKRRVALLVALADLGGVWSLPEVTDALTSFADRAVASALGHGIAREVARGRLPDPGAGAALGLVAIAMGKLGAGELNYSSDIDLIMLYDQDRFPSADAAELRAGFVRATRTMTATLSDLTGEGYVFRTDLRLRPDPAVTPVAMSMEAAERYYESVGRTWERAAHIKARAAAGDVDAGAAYLDRLAPFVWRRHLDFAAIRDAHDIRLKIRDHKALFNTDSLAGRDLKLGAGGIREIEFFTQTRQLIAGGRDPSLRLRATVPALQRLHDAGWCDDAETLIEDYTRFRDIEHRLQMVGDQQTHALPTTEAGFDRIAALMGAERSAFMEDLALRLARVRRISEQFFGQEADRMAGPVIAGPTEHPDAWETMQARWRGYPALRSQRAIDSFKRIAPRILDRVARAGDADEALGHLDGFLAGLPAGVQLFALFEANPQLVDLVVDIAAIAPRLARYLARNAGVFDAVLDGDFFAAWPGGAALQADLAGEMAREDDYERRLDAARRWMKDWHFRVGVHHLRGVIDAEVAGTQYADIAGAVAGALWPEVVDGFAAKHGAPPGHGAAVMAMGSLGSARMTARSDLDLIVIYDPAGVDMSDGRRPLQVRTYYARLTQAFVTALSAPMAEGKLYDVDMRLRPSGRQGPVATSLAAFTDYQSDHAWTWEHLALTRARFVAGSETVGHDVEAFRRNLLARDRDPDGVLQDVAKMRARLAAAAGPDVEVLEAKAERGRLQDVSLLAQTNALLAGTAVRGVAEQLAVAGPLLFSDSDRETLRNADRLFWALQASGHLILDGALDPAALGEGARAFLLKQTGEADMAALERAMTATAAAAAGIIDRILEAEEAGDGG